MDLQRIKEIINKAGFSEETQNKLNNILDKALKRGVLTEEEKKKMLAIIDLEIEAANLEAEALEETALALESLAGDLDNSAEMLAEDLEAIESDFAKDAGEFKKKVDTASS